MNDVVNSFLLIYAGLFPIINPIGSAPIFLSLTQQLCEAERQALAARVAFNAFCLLLASLFMGSYVLQFFGITLSAVRIGGGLVVVAFAWKLLNAEEAVKEQSVAGTTERTSPRIDAFYPLTMPLTVGPGSISVAIALGSDRPNAGAGFAYLALIYGGAIAGLIAIAATVYVFYRFGPRLLAALGESGTNVLMRLIAFILLCIGIQIIWNGYSAFMGIAS